MTDQKRETAARLILGNYPVAGPPEGRREFLRSLTDDDVRLLDRYFSRLDAWDRKRDEMDEYERDLVRHILRWSRAAERES